jgi:hypothetical protein
LSPSVKLIKKFLSFAVGRNRLECFSLARFFQAASLKFVGKVSSSTLRVKYHIEFPVFLANIRLA